MAFLLPFNSQPDNVQRVQIDEETYDFRYRWNSREKAWYCYIGLNGDEPKVKFKIVVGMDLLGPHKAYPEVPPGVFVCIDTEQNYGRPGRDNVGPEERFKLFYADVDEDLTAFIKES